MVETLLTGQYKYLVWFGVVVIFIYLPLMWLWRRRKKDKAEIFEHDHRDAVKAYIEQSEANDLLTVISINGEEPVMYAKGLKYGVYLLPGENVIHLVYQWTSRSITSLTGYETHEIPDKKLTMIVEENKEYSLLYNHTLKKYQFKENKN